MGWPPTVAAQAMLAATTPTTISRRRRNEYTNRQHPLGARMQGCTVTQIERRKRRGGCFCAAFPQRPRSMSQAGPRRRGTHTPHIPHIPHTSHTPAAPRLRTRVPVPLRKAADRRQAQGGSRRDARRADAAHTYAQLGASGVNQQFKIQQAFVLVFLCSLRDDDLVRARSLQLLEVTSCDDEE